jgi:hypothetical protein
MIGLAHITSASHRPAHALGLLDDASQRLEDGIPVPLNLLAEVVQFLRDADDRQISRMPLQTMEDAVRGLQCGQGTAAGQSVRSAREYLAISRDRAGGRTWTSRPLFQQLVDDYASLTENDHDRPALHGSPDGKARRDGGML